MSLDTLTAVSPIDGRYRSKTESLQDYFSEFALIRYRIRVEIEYFISLCERPLPQLAQFPKNLFPRLRCIYTQFTTADAQRVKTIEHTTNHDVKAVEYFIKEQFDTIGGLDAYKEFVHFGLTSQDINNTAVPLSLQEALNDVYYPMISQLVDTIKQYAEEWQDVAMLAKTHGQPASPTRLGKELMVFAYRLQQQLKALRSCPVTAKFGGATGNFNAHHVAYPGIDWRDFANEFLAEKLGLQREQFTTQISNYGTGQWKQVVLYSSNDKFALVDGTTNDNHTADQTYSSMTDGSCYAIGSGTGGSLSLSSATCPSAPTVTASAASSVTNTTATINGSIGGNGNDAITDYGFYWSTTQTTATALQSSGTKVQKGTSDYTGSISTDLSSLTAGTTVYYIAYATNGQGTTLSSVQSFTVPYKVTITNPTGATISPSGVQYVTTTLSETSTASTGYTFSSWTTGNCSMSSTSTSAGVTTATLTPSADNATLTAVYTENMTTVTLATNNSHGHIEIGGETVTSTTAGVATTRSITAVPFPLS